MKNRIIFVILAVVALGAFAFGASGTLPFAAAEAAEATDADKDRLVGVFITTEYLDLFDRERFLQDNTDQLLSGKELGEADAGAYQGRLYADLVDDPYTNPLTGETSTTKSFVFPGVDGIGYFAAWYSLENESYWSMDGDDPVCDGHSAFHSTDAGDSIDLSGTIYVSTLNGPDCFYYNPVYQTPAGEVYAVTGQGMSYSGAIVAGMAGTHALKEEQTVTVNGKSEIIGTSVSMRICFMDTPTDCRLLQFDKNGGVISEQRYAPGCLPLQITAEPGAEYLIVETSMQSADGTETAVRELFQPEDETLFAFFCREDGICVKQFCSIVWAGSQLQSF